MLRTAVSPCVCGSRAATRFARAITSPSSPHIMCGDDARARHRLRFANPMSRRPNPNPPGFVSNVGSPSAFASAAALPAVLSAWASLSASASASAPGFGFGFGFALGFGLASASALASASVFGSD